MDNDEDNNDEEESEDEVVFIETRDEEMGKCVILLILLAFLKAFVGPVQIAVKK